MLSLSVICAIEVLLRMDAAQEGVQVKKNKSGICVYNAMDAGGMYRPTIRSVIGKLLQGGYICHANVSNRFVLLKDPSQITVLELVRFFHGGICLGEIYSHYLVLGHVNSPTSSYCSLMRYEGKLKRTLEARLRIPISIFQDSAVLAIREAKAAACSIPDNQVPVPGD